MENQKKEEKQKKRLLPVICGIVLLLLLIAALLLGLHSCDRDTDTDDETKSTSAPTEPSAAVVLEKINIQSHPTKTEYFPGETLDTTGLTLNAFYSNGTREVITEGFTCDPTTMTETGVHPITVRYQDKETRFYVTVKDASITGLTISTLPTKTQYFTGDAIDPAGLTLIATYDNGTEKTITEGFTIAPNQLLSAGTQEVTVSYEGLDVRFTVQVEDAVLESISLKTLPNKTVYFQNEILDTTGLSLLAAYSNGSTAIITGGFTYDTQLLPNIGTQTVTVQYGGKATSFDVTVSEVVMTGLSVATKPSKTSYFVGDSLNTSGLTLTATYNDGSKKTITSGFTCTPTKLSTAGTQKITVQYGGKSTSFDVTVSEVVMTGISVATKPSKTSYFVGDTLNTSGLTLTASYNNGAKKTITSGFTCTPTKLSTASTQKITVQFGGLTTSFDVTVSEVVMTGISVATKPSKTSYFVGDSLNTSGLTLTAIYNNGSKKTITSGFTCTPTKLSTAGIQTITVQYGGKTTSFNVTVTAVQLTGISIATPPNKTTYFMGDILDLTGLTLTASYNDGSKKTITSGFSCNPTELSTAGTQKIGVLYGNKVAYFEVTVKAPELTGIYVAYEPVKTWYFVGDTLDTTRLILTATYNNGTQKTLTSGFTCTPTKLTTVGTQKITVSYGGKTTSFNVTVIEPEATGISISTMPSKTTYYLGERLDTTGLTIAVSWSDGSTTIVQGSDSKLDFYPTEMDQLGSRDIQVFYNSKRTLFRVQVKDPIIGSGTCGDNLTWELTGTGILTIRGTGAMYDYNSSNKAPWRFKSDFLASGEINQINLPNGLTHIGADAFYFCYGYTTVTIPNTVQTIGHYAFAESTTLKEMTLPDNVTSLGSDAFRGCSKLETLKIGKGLKTLGGELFARCGSLRQVWVDPANQYFAHSSEGALFTKDMKALILFPRNIPGRYVMPNTVERIQIYAFQYCHLTEVVLPSSLKKISNSAFLWCDTITSITIPASVEEIGIHAFMDCDALTKIYVLNPDCAIYMNYDDTLGTAGQTTVYGYAGSTAEAYCQKYGYTFVAI